MDFLTQKVAIHNVWGKLCGFVDYNVKHVVFIVAYITPKLNLTLDYDTCYKTCQLCVVCDIT